MAGHSKWANIQHRKKAQDSKRGQLFTKLIRAITVAARTGGPEAANNPRLRDAVDKALDANMTRDTIDRAIKRGAGMDGDTQYEEVRYEGYGPNGIAVLVDCMTDNRQRTVAEVRHAFTKHGGSLGVDGSVAYLFEKKGVLTFAPGTNETTLLEQAIEAGADDVLTHSDGSADVLTQAENFHDVKTKLETSGLKPDSADITYVPSTSVDLSDADHEKAENFIEALESLDDVQHVYTNIA